LERVDDYDSGVGQRAFLQACSQGWFRCLEALLRVWRPVTFGSNEAYPTPLARSCYAKGAEVLKLLLSHGYGKEPDEVSAALTEACSSNNLEAVRVLLGLNVVQLHIWKHAARAIYFIFKGHYDSKTSIQIFELLVTHGLNVNAAKVDCAEGVFVDVCRFVKVESLNAILRAMKRLPKSQAVNEALSCVFENYSRGCMPEPWEVRPADILATLRVAGIDTDSFLVKKCAKRETSYLLRQELRILVASGANVNAKKKDKPVIYLVASRHFDAALIGLMMQAGAIFDADALIACTPRDHKAQMRDLIAHFSSR
jgi:hypothetical protein